MEKYDKAGNCNNSNGMLLGYSKQGYGCKYSSGTGRFYSGHNWIIKSEYDIRLKPLVITETHFFSALSD